MTSQQDAHYRLRVAIGFLNEAQQDLALQRWRSCMDNAQLSVEHAAKAVLALLGPVGRTHNPAIQLRQSLADGRFAPAQQNQVIQLAEHAERLGADIHIQTDYGDEVGGRTPWELFDEADAQQALTFAQESVSLANTIITQKTTQ